MGGDSPAGVRPLSGSPWLSREPTPFAAGKEIFKWNTLEVTLTLTEKRMLPAYGAWGPGRGVDTVPLTPTLAETSAMLQKQRVLFSCPTRNKRACQAQIAYPLFSSAGEGGSASIFGHCTFFHRDVSIGSILKIEDSHKSWDPTEGRCTPYQCLLHFLRR